jgi:hypothetical protein
MGTSIFGDICGRDGGRILRLNLGAYVMTKRNRDKSGDNSVATVGRFLHLSYSRATQRHLSAACCARRARLRPPVLPPEMFPAA